MSILMRKEPLYTFRVPGETHKRYQILLEVRLEVDSKT